MIRRISLFLLFCAIGHFCNTLPAFGQVTWTSQTSGTSNYLTGVTFGNSIYVAVGGGGEERS